jgi:hypothetical protein
MASTTKDNSFLPLDTHCLRLSDEQALQAGLGGNDL